MADVSDHRAQQGIVIWQFTIFDVAADEVAEHAAEILVARVTHGRARDAGKIIYSLRRSRNCGFVSSDPITYLRIRRPASLFVGKHLSNTSFLPRAPPPDGDESPRSVREAAVAWPHSAP